MSLKKTKEDLQVVQLDPQSHALIKIWPSVTTAARELPGTREGIYQSTRDGSVRYGSRWMFYSTFKAKEHA